MWCQARLLGMGVSLLNSEIKSVSPFLNEKKALLRSNWKEYAKFMAEKNKLQLIKKKKKRPSNEILLKPKHCPQIRGLLMQRRLAGGEAGGRRTAPRCGEHG